jgi:hypothetical protein
MNPVSNMEKEDILFQLTNMCPLFRASFITEVSHWVNPVNNIFRICPESVEKPAMILTISTG